MSKTYIAAHTPLKGYAYYPPFINISRDDTTGETVVILRGNEAADGKCGSAVEARFAHDEFALFLVQAVAAELAQRDKTIDGLRAAFEATKGA